MNTFSQLKITHQISTNIHDIFYEQHLIFVYKKIKLKKFEKLFFLLVKAVGCKATKFYLCSFVPQFVAASLSAAITRFSCSSLLNLSFNDQTQRMRKTQPIIIRALKCENLSSIFSDSRSNSDFFTFGGPLSLIIVGIITAVIVTMSKIAFTISIGRTNVDFRCEIEILN